MKLPVLNSQHANFLLRDLAHRIYFLQPDHVAGHLRALVGTNSVRPHLLSVDLVRHRAHRLTLDVDLSVVAAYRTFVAHFTRRRIFRKYLTNGPSSVERQTIALLVEIPNVLFLIGTLLELIHHFLDHLVTAVMLLRHIARLIQIAAGTTFLGLARTVVVTHELIGTRPFVVRDIVYDAQTFLIEAHGCILKD